MLEAFKQASEYSTSITHNDATCKAENQMLTVVRVMPVGIMIAFVCTTYDIFFYT